MDLSPTCRVPEGRSRGDPDADLIPALSSMPERNTSQMWTIRRHQKDEVCDAYTATSTSLYGRCGRHIHPTPRAGDWSVSSRIRGYGQRRRGHRVECTRGRGGHEGMHRP